jgi:hypothetical protein
MSGSGRGVAGGVVPCADASVAINPVTAQIAQDATPAKLRRVSMTDLPVVSGSLCPDLSDDTRHFLTPVSAQKCLSGMCLASGKQCKCRQQDRASSVVIASVSEAIHASPNCIASQQAGLLRRRACHRARIRATRWLLATTTRLALLMFCSPKKERGRSPFLSEITIGASGASRSHRPSHPSAGASHSRRHIPRDDASRHSHPNDGASHNHPKCAGGNNLHRRNGDASNGPIRCRRNRPVQRLMSSIPEQTRPRWIVQPRQVRRGQQVQKQVS